MSAMVNLRARRPLSGPLSTTTCPNCILHHVPSLPPTLALTASCCSTNRADGSTHRHPRHPAPALQEAHGIALPTSFSSDMSPAINGRQCLPLPSASSRTFTLLAAQHRCTKEGLACSSSGPASPEDQWASTTHHSKRRPQPSQLKQQDPSRHHGLPPVPAKRTGPSHSGSYL
jgi:hypothetical protein